MERFITLCLEIQTLREYSIDYHRGLPIAVIDPGIQNTDAGPDFFNAKVKIDGTVWAGSVDIHEKLPIGCYIIMIRIRHMTPLSCM